MQDQRNNIMVVGDVHGEWAYLNTLINRKRPAILIACGDFGFWPNEPLYDPKKIRNHDTKVYWCDGNHEDFGQLAPVAGTEVYPGVFHMKRGSVLTLPDGRRVMFFGGATSVDRSSRTPGYDWFPEEVPNMADLEAAERADPPIDIVISHTCPRGLIPEMLPRDPRCRDITCDALSLIWARFQPKLWYFGHWHVRKEGDLNGCQLSSMSSCSTTNSSVSPGEITTATKSQMVSGPYAVGRCISTLTVRGGTSTEQDSTPQTTPMRFARDFLPGRNGISWVWSDTSSNQRSR